MAISARSGIAGGIAGGLAWIAISYIREGTADWVGAVIFAVAFSAGWILIARWREKQ
ncbi:MAG: hypothetical protein KO206_08795 [Methanomicrobiaceae archaeon]|nr:hypothetical protein [Methanomicrobiaceae archaeon]MDD5418769.1 hypothetical protein [Methanomicrobiaceae archaeon]